MDFQKYLVMYEVLTTGTVAIDYWNNFFHSQPCGMNRVELTTCVYNKMKTSVMITLALLTKYKNAPAQNFVGLDISCSCRDR